MRYLLLLPLVGLSVGCAPIDWREAARTDTSAAWLAYANANPGTLKAEAAARRAEARGWEEAVAANTGTAYASYYAAFPKGKHLEEAYPLAIELGWTEASADGTIPALAAYARRWPASPHAPEALTRIEDLVYAQCHGEGTADSYGRYLAQYPGGRYAAEARAERDQLVWTENAPLSTRLAYERYLKEFPSGLHATEARAWLRATYVTKLQPVVALVSTFQPSSARAGLLTRVQTAFDKTFLPDVRSTFELLPTKAIDATGGMAPPQETLGTAAGTGILMVEYRETEGRAFYPTGTATDADLVLRLYAPNTPNPVWVRMVKATTPDTVRGKDLGALNQAAIQELVDALHVYASDLASQKAKEGT